MDHTAFKKFLSSSGLSTRQFGDICGIGKSTVHRLAQPGHGGLTPAYLRKITPVLIKGCRFHLESCGAGAGEIHARLSAIFAEEIGPAIETRRVLTREVLEFFGLERDPFAAPRTVDELFTTVALDEAFDHIEEAVKWQGFAAILAPVGAGKTMLKKRFVNANPSALIIEPRFADMSRVTAAGIVTFLLESFGIKPRRTLVLAQKQLEEKLGELTAEGNTVALFFDECHQLADQTLTALKNFYEMGSGGFERYLGLVLFGQPRFRERLAYPQFREIAERLETFDLPLLSPPETVQCLNHSLKLAYPQRLQLHAPSHTKSAFATVGEGAPTIFEESAVQLIASRASTPLAIGNLAASAMIEAYRKGEAIVTVRFVGEETGPRSIRP